MPLSRRQLVRTSILALITSYLRDGVTTDTSFSLNSDATSKYPFLIDGPLFMFTMNSELWRITIAEVGQLPPDPGVTIEFFEDVPEESKSMPQVWNLGVRIRVRLPWDYNGDGTALQIAEKIDEALYRSNGKIQIKDYSTDPATAKGRYITWATVPRGVWAQIAPTTLLTDLGLEMRMQYSTPDL